jgi:hypothetical protein
MHDMEIAHVPRCTNNNAKTLGLKDLKLSDVASRSGIHLQRSFYQKKLSVSGAPSNNKNLQTTAYVKA